MTENRIKIARLQANKTQQEAADAISSSVDKIWRLETGKKSPTLEEATILAELYGTSVAYLAGEIADNMRKNIIEQKSPQPHHSPVETSKLYNQELPPNVKKIRGKTYVDGVPLDTFARQLRDRLIIEIPANDDATLTDVKDALHECLRLLENTMLKHKIA